MLSGIQTRGEQNKIFYGLLFNHELDILEILLNEIYNEVDRVNKISFLVWITLSFLQVDVIILVECRLSFQLTTKKLHYNDNKQRFQKFWAKIRHIIVSEKIISEKVIAPHERVRTGNMIRDDHIWMQHSLRTEKERRRMSRESDSKYSPGGRKASGIRTVSVRVGGAAGSKGAKIWSVQWYLRKVITLSAPDLGDNDILFWADADEIVSSEWLRQLKVCSLAAVQDGFFSVPLKHYFYRFACVLPAKWKKLSFGRKLFSIIRASDFHNTFFSS